jgi:prevent-host-death family protein
VNRIPELIPISDIRQRQNEILASLRNGPIVLTQHGRAAAVLLAPDEYNRLVAALEDLEDALDAAEARREPGAADLEDYLARRDRAPAAD